MHQLYDERVRQIDVIQENMITTPEALKKQVWREFLSDVTNQFQAVLQRHQDF